METEIVKLPKEVVEKAEIVGNILDELAVSKENYEKLFIKVFIIFRDRYHLTGEQWNEDIAPIFRKYWIGKCLIN